MKILISLFITVLPGLLLANNSTLEVRKYTYTVDQEKITLATLTNLEGLDNKLQEDLKKVELSHAPKFGESVTFSSQGLSTIFRKKLPLSLAAKYRLVIPSNVVVENRGYIVTIDRVQSELRKVFSQFCSTCRFDISQLSIPVVDSERPRQPWTLKPPTVLPKGNFNVALQFLDGKTPLWVTGQLKVIKEVPVLSRAIEFGQRLTKEDIVFEWRDVTFSHDSNPPLKQIIGKKVKTAMNVGQILWQSSIVREKALNRGDLVRVLTGNDQFQVSILAKALQDGYVGDRVNLQSLERQKLMTGIITKKGEVSIP